MIDQQLLYTLKRATGDWKMTVTPAGRPGKWVLGFQSTAPVSAVEADLEGVGVTVVSIEAVSATDYIAIVDQSGKGAA